MNECNFKLSDHPLLSVLIGVCAGRAFAEGLLGAALEASEQAEKKTNSIAESFFNIAAGAAIGGIRGALLGGSAVLEGTFQTVAFVTLVSTPVFFSVGAVYAPFIVFGAIMNAK